MKKISKFVLAMALASAAQPAFAETITFEGQSNAQYIAPITRGNFVIGNPVGDEQHFHEIDSTQFGLASNGTGVLLNDRNTRIFLEALSGGLFSLNSFDIAASLGNGPADSFVATGFLNGATVGTISGALGQFATFSGFGTGVDRVEFDGIGSGGGFELDNIVLNEAVAAVPEPATWALMLLGFGVIGTSLRRRKRLLAGTLQAA